MKYKLICVDIDGTLLNDEKKMPVPVRDSLRRASGMGMKIALISGRMPVGVEAIEEELGFPCIKACNAGTYILLEDQCISSEHLMPGIMREIYRELAAKNNLPLWIFQERKWFVTGIDQYIEREIEIIRCQPEIVDPEYLADQFEQKKTGPSKLLLAADADTIRRLQGEIEGRQMPDIDIACSADTFLEIFPKGVTKGKALSVICRKLGINPEDTIAFGDHELDIPMIEAAGVGIAMGNAIDELKERADIVTRSNNNAGIACILDRYLSDGTMESAG